MRRGADHGDLAASGATLGTSIAMLAANLVAGIVIARSLGVDGRGQVAALVLWATLAVDLALFGTPAAIVYSVARDPRGSASVASTIRRWLPAQAAAGVAIYAGLVWVGGISATTSAIVAFALLVPFRMLFESVLAVAQGERDFVRFNQGRFVVALAPAALFAALALAGLLSVAWAGIGYTFALVIGGLVLRKAAGHVARGESHSAPTGYRSYAARNWAAVLSAKGNNNVDLLILTIAGTSASAGLYAVATSAASVLALVGNATGMVALPRLAAMPVPEANHRAYRYFAFALGGTLTLAALLFLSVGWLIPFVFGTEFTDAVVLARILVVGFVGVSLAGLASAILRSRNRPGSVALAQAAGLAFTLVYALANDPSSAVTVAVASTVGFWLAAALQMAVVLLVRGDEAQPEGRSNSGRADGDATGAN